MSASQQPITDYPWLQEHLRDLVNNQAEMAVQAKLEADGQVYPHDIEDPAGCWIELVMACNIQDHNARKQHVLKWNALARGSRWNREMLLSLREQEEDEPEVEYGGPFADNQSPRTVKDLLDAADAEAFKEEHRGANVDAVSDEEPMTEPFMEE